MIGAAGQALMVEAMAQLLKAQGRLWQRLEKMEAEMATKQDLDDVIEAVTGGLATLAAEMTKAISDLQGHIAAGFDPTEEVTTLSAVVDQLDQLVAQARAAQG